jgi:hypothetical protein
MAFLLLKLFKHPLKAFYCVAFSGDLLGIRQSEEQRYTQHGISGSLFI